MKVHNCLGYIAPQEGFFSIKDNRSIGGCGGNNTLERKKRMDVFFKLINRQIYEFIAYERLNNFLNEKETEP